MFFKIAAKRQVTLPARVPEALGVKPGDRIELEEGPDGFVLRARHIDRARLAPLRGKLRRGKGTFGIEAFRNEDDLLAKAQRVSGVKEKPALVREGPQALIRE